MRASTFAFAALLAPVVAWASGSASPKPPAPPKVDLHALPATATVRPDQPGEKAHPVTAHLLADEDAVAPGSTVRVGVLLEQQPGWHTYWKSPGDIGLPTQITWTLPQGFAAAPYQYPIPQRFELEGIVSYGYEDQVMLIAPVTVPADAKPGKVDLSAEVSWLVCQENCIPGDAKLTLPIEVAASGSAKNAYAPLFDHYEKQWVTDAKAVSGIAFQTALSTSAVHPEDKFRFAIVAKPSTGKLSPPPADGTWPVFTPIVDPNVMVSKATARATPDGGVVVVIEGETLAADPVPATTPIGGLLQLQQGDQWVRTEVVAEIPWVAKGVATTPGDPGVWQAVDQVLAAPAPTASPKAGDLPPPPIAPAVAPDASPMSLPGMLAFAFLGGLLLNIMPCVLPVLTLKLYGLVENAEATPAHRRAAGVAYTAGILASFLALAAVVLILKQSMGGVGWGFQFQYPPYVAALGAIVFAFGLSMFGVFEIPAVGANAASQASDQGGLAGHFATGVFATLLGTPCSAPFLGPAVGFAFSQSAPVIALFFGIIGLGLATPFLVVAFVPALFALMPRPGAWMDTFKQLMGFTLMATTVWLVKVLAAQLGLQQAIGYLAFLCSVGMGAWVFGHWGGLAESGRRQAVAGIAGLAIVGLGGRTFLDLEPEVAVACDSGKVDVSTLSYNDGIPWQSFSQARVDALKGKPVFIDFTADWCLTCKVNENTILSRDGVRKAMEDRGVVPLRADWTKRDPTITEWLTRFGRAGVPFYVVLPADPSKQPIALPEVLTEDAVVTALADAG